MEQETDQIQINFKALWQVLLKEKWLILGISFAFAIVGIFYVNSLKEEFVADGKILPELQGKSGGASQIASLAALAGVDLSSSGGGSDAVRPDLYPDVLKGTQFFLSLLETKFNDKNGNILEFNQFYTKSIFDKEIKKEDQKLNFALSENYTVINRFTENAIKNLKTRIICIYDKKTGIINISVKMPDPVIAASVARYSMNYLTNYIVNYRTEKQKRDLDFLAERLAAAKGKYYNNQSQKASYTDLMPINALRLQSADLQRERIESDYKISNNFYNTLLQKYEEAKLKMQQETPVIKVLEAPVVPNYKSEPKKVILVFSVFVIGLICSLVLAFVKQKFLN